MLYSDTVPIGIREWLIFFQRYPIKLEKSYLLSDFEYAPIEILTQILGLSLIFEAESAPFQIINYLKKNRVNIHLVGEEKPTLDAHFGIIEGEPLASLDKSTIEFCEAIQKEKIDDRIRMNLHIGAQSDWDVIKEFCAKNRRMINSITFYDVEQHDQLDNIIALCPLITELRFKRNENINFSLLPSLSKTGTDRKNCIA